MILIDGKATAAQIRAELKEEAASIVKSIGRAPGLAVVLVGDDPASAVYVRSKGKACDELGFKSVTHKIPGTSTMQELEALIDNLNADNTIDGILVQLPLPAGLDTQRILDRISPEKDVDGFHPQNMGRLALGLPGFRPCTPAGVMVLMKRYGLSPNGKKSVMVGRSNIVGKPLSMMLVANDHNANSTVTMCHSRTADLKKECLEADFLFLAMGKPKCITADMVKEGAVVMDIGINRIESGLVGDADFEAMKDKVQAITPVPGGVGPMTIAMLMVNTLYAYKRRNGLPADLSKYGIA
ncbi:bifunctional methylenetetrahydrofolate dehydrogenase/methenyltetrahydrofolate cyclohydrolase FolD [Desulfovibrio sp. OttesenSCG-928-F07]|nr:bifunctional methylenetetrahydrofolate dehydrogenase/methenyltetrahydrofolate cyclohydrolase FolD [Desulfovibrio sp. OttesenSCG-928-F07]